ncbi:MucBP domain-containing protein [Carnobacterium sp. FSL E2-0243]|uniref:MucBP domain-containing protein n=1 Tax=Carnobacterium sp. FSL E2-0243 TaxID=2921365 RepID=UPI0030FA9799
MKKLVMFFALIVIIGNAMTIKVSAAENESKVFTESVLFDSLSQSEKESIIKEQPNVPILYNQENFKLVYKKITQGSLVTKTINPTKVGNDSNKIMTKSEGSLPQAGELKINSLLFLIGALFIIVATSLMIWKRKQIKTVLLFLILVGGVGFSSTVDASGDMLPDSSMQLLSKGNSTYTINTSIDGYEYIGYIHTNSGELPIAQKGQVVVKHQDKDGQRLSEDDVLSGASGESYNLEPKTIDGYTFKEVQGNTNGTFTNNYQTIIFVYEKNIQISFVTGIYTDKDGQKLSEDDVLSGAVGESYHLEPKEFTGYTLKEVLGDEMGTFSKESAAVIFVYSKDTIEGTIDLEQSGFINATDRGFIKPNFYKVTYYDIDGNVLKTDVINEDTVIENQQVNVAVGESYTVYSRVTYECYSIENGDRLSWGDYELVADNPSLTTGIMKETQLKIKYTFYDLSNP